MSRQCLYGIVGEHTCQQGFTFRIQIIMFCVKITLNCKLYTYTNKEKCICIIPTQNTVSREQICPKRIERFYSSMALLIYNKGPRVIPSVHCTLYNALYISKFASYVRKRDSYEYIRKRVTYIR